MTTTLVIHINRNGNVPVQQVSQHIFFHFLTSYQHFIFFSLHFVFIFDLKCKMKQIFIVSYFFLMLGPDLP